MPFCGPTPALLSLSVSAEWTQDTSLHLFFPMCVAQRTPSGNRLLPRVILFATAWHGMRPPTGVAVCRYLNHITAKRLTALAWPVKDAFEQPFHGGPTTLNRPALSDRSYRASTGMPTQEHGKWQGLGGVERSVRQFFPLYQVLFSMAAQQCGCTAQSACHGRLPGATDKTPPDAGRRSVDGRPDCKSGPSLSHGPL